jgi:RNA polymerase sigma-70 factor (ECF subfamily)
MLLGARALPPPANLDALELTLTALLASARDAWPGVDVAPHTFLPHLAERLSPEGQLDERLARAHVTDLYLACACASGDKAALELFEERFLRHAGDAIARIDGTPAFVDEVRQQLRDRLLVGPAPRIADYAGSGALDGWVKVAGMRVALNLRRSTQAKERAERVLALELPVGDDPELEIIKQQYSGAVAGALSDALALLSADERQLLRLHYVDGLNLDKIGALHNVNKSTVSRWLATARLRVLEEAKRVLVTRLQITDATLHSLLRVVRDDLELSLSGLLRGG